MSSPLSLRFLSPVQGPCRSLGAEGPFRLGDTGIRNHSRILLPPNAEIPYPTFKPSQILLNLLIPKELPPFYSIHSYSSLSNFFRFVLPQYPTRQNFCFKAVDPISSFDYLVFSQVPWFKTHESVVLLGRSRVDRDFHILESLPRPRLTSGTFFRYPRTR